MKPSERSIYKFWYLGDHQGLQVYLLIKGNFIIHLYVKSFSEVFIFLIGQVWLEFAHRMFVNRGSVLTLNQFVWIIVNLKYFFLTLYQEHYFLSLVSHFTHSVFFWVNGILCFSRKQNLKFLFFYVIVCFFL